MKKEIHRLVLIVILLFGLNAPVHAVLPIERFETQSGVQVLFMRADAIPMLDIEVKFDAGDRLDLFGSIGVASLTASMLDAGAGARSEAELADAFARTGARRTAWADDDSASVRLRTVLTEPELSSALSLFTDMITRPNFEAGAVSREKQRIRQAIREGKKRAGVIARRAFYPLVYDKHPYGFLLDESGLEAISPARLREFHRTYYTRSRASIAMIGAISRDRAEQIAASIVAGLAAGGPVDTVYPEVALLTAAKQKSISHPGAQSHILIGAPLMARGDPDYFALMLANSVLGGASFVSRLYQEVREKRGLTYSISSGFSLKVQPGLFSISLQTRREKTAEALALVNRVVSDYVANGPTAKELESARTNLTGGFVFRIDSNRKILGLMSAIGYYRLGLDYLERWVERINAVTLDQVRDALRRRLDPTKMVTVVVGADVGGAVSQKKK